MQNRIGLQDLQCDWLIVLLLLSCLYLLLFLFFNATGALPLKRKNYNLEGYKRLNPDMPGEEDGNP
jgi:hypothetical protein